MAGKELDQLLLFSPSGIKIQPFDWKGSIEYSDKIVSVGPAD